LRHFEMAKVKSKANAYDQLTANIFNRMFLAVSIRIKRPTGLKLGRPLVTAEVIHDNLIMIHTDK